MSRRKQAKPRFLKHDETDETEPNNEPNVNESIDNECSDDEKEDEDNNGEDEDGDENDENISTPEKPQIKCELYSSKTVTPDNENGANLNENLDNHTIELKPLIIEATIISNNDDDDDDKITEDLLDNEDFFDDDDDDYDDDGSDSYSDSYCSDIFSSHTSSSFSPSLSDDIPTTPNSLLNHQHLHHHHHSHHHQPHHNHHHLHHHTNDDNTSDRGGHQISTVDNNNMDKSIDGAAIDLKRKSTDSCGDHHDGTTNGGGVAGDDTKKIKRENFGKDGKPLGHGHGGSSQNGGGTMKHPNKSSKISSDGNYHCQFCEKVFPRLGYLKKHEQSHAEHMPFKCEYCARLFKHKRSRDRHTKLHTGDRRYKCPHCEAAFSRSDHLKIHMKTHDNQKPFQCTVCNRGYNTAAALTSHMQNHKKQAALLANGGNGGNLNYSPRSTGSTGSSTSSLHKRKYSNIPLDQLNAQQQQLQTHQPQQKLPRSMIACVFCTKSDFHNVDQLNHHVQAMHHHQGTKVQPPVSTGSASNASASAACSPSNPLISCEFCTMKFASIQQIFQHLKTTHMDRISSPNSYLEHFNRNLMSTYEMTQSALSPTSLLYQQAALNHKFLPVVKQEAKTPDINADGQGGSVQTVVTPPIIKHESEDAQDQDSPTDLSQPKSKMFIKDESNHSATSNSNNNNHHNSNASNGDRTPETIPKSPILQSGTFLCNQCNAALPDFESFRTHLKSHLDSGVGSYLCQHCGIPFNDQQIYEKHLFSHFLMNVTEYPCPQSCNKNFTKQEEYQKHLMDTHIQTVYKCEICSEIFDTKISIQVHMSVAHPSEVKLYRCSACMEVYRNERDFRQHVRARHIISGAVQCIFCRQICSSELDMHFHLAAHARQYRCPVCPESFHVEFLLDRHMQTVHHHGVAGVAASERPKDAYHHKISVSNNNNNNNNNNTIDYHLSGAAAKSGHHQSYPFNTSKFYNQLQIDTLGAKHPSLLHGLYDSISKNQRYPHDNGFLSPNKNLLGLYNHPEMIAKLNSFYNQSENGERLYQPQLATHTQQAPSATSSASRYSNHTDATIKSHLSGTYSSTHHGEKGYSCGMCERNDFSTENEVHSHRKLVHNLKTGVSLRCAYCNGDFRSRSELENHMKVSHNTSGKHKCLICDEIFPSPAVLAEHKLTHCKVGPSGRCSHCLIELKDVTFFKSHLAEHNGHDIPIQCICCRQTLNSEFEIGLHAKFHTKSSEVKENTCALCLETLPPNVETRVCESCYKKHNLNLKTNILQQQHNGSSNSNNNNNNNNNNSNNNSNSNNNKNRDNLNIIQEAYCNLCKKTFPNQIRLQEHLIEHTFAGCEDRGYICYICSAVFTSPGGLQSHIIEHGLNARPYDCNLCPAKYFFRAELDNHTIEHENNNAPASSKSINLLPPAPPAPPPPSSSSSSIVGHNSGEHPENLKKEITVTDEHNSTDEIKHHPHDEEEEYIEVENLEPNHHETKLDNK